MSEPGCLALAPSPGSPWSQAGLKSGVAEMPHIELTESLFLSLTRVLSSAPVGAASAQQARVIVSNALKLYSQDKTGMVDFALESGGECLTPQPRAGAGTWASAPQPEGEQYSRCVPRSAGCGCSQMTGCSGTPELLIIHSQSCVL